MTQLLLIWLLSFSFIAYSAQELDELESALVEEDIIENTEVANENDLDLESVQDESSTNSEEISEFLQEDAQDLAEPKVGDDQMMQEQEDIVVDESASQESEVVMDEQVDLEEDVSVAGDMLEEQLEKDVFAIEEEQVAIDVPEMSIDDAVESKVILTDELMPEAKLSVDEQELVEDVVALPEDNNVLVSEGELFIDDELVVEDEVGVEQDLDGVLVQEQVVDEEDEIQGITTVDLDEPRGNWLFKRIWWERSEGRYEKIRELLNAINDTRIYFFTQSIDLDKNLLDPFYLEINFERGTLNMLLEELAQRLNQERIEDGMLDAQEREILDQVEQEKTMLLQLQEDVKSILAMDNKVNDVLGRVMDQMQRVNKYERDAWQSMKEIARILDDIQARDLYYKVDTAWRNVKEVAHYLESDLKRHFDELVATTKEQTGRITMALNSLQERGVLLKQELQALDDYESMVEAQEEIDLLEDEELIVKQPVGWFGGIWQWLVSWF